MASKQSIRFVVDDNNPRFTRIFLGDAEVGRFIKKAEINLSGGKIPEVILHCVGHVELPKEFTAIIMGVIDDDDSTEAKG